MGVFKKTSRRARTSVILQTLHFLSTGILAATQPLKPPRSALALKPFLFSICAARALVCSSGQAQYVTISLPGFNSPSLPSSAVKGTLFDPGIRLSLES